MVNTTGEHDHVVAYLRQGRGEVTSDEPGPPGDRYAHRLDGSTVINCARLGLHSIATSFSSGRARQVAGMPRMTRPESNSTAPRGNSDPSPKKLDATCSTSSGRTDHLPHWSPQALEATGATCCRVAERCLLEELGSLLEGRENRARRQLAGELHRHLYVGSPVHAGEGDLVVPLGLAHLEAGSVVLAWEGTATEQDR